MAGYYDRDRTNSAGLMQQPGAYIGNTSEYMVSGWPYAETVESTTTITFTSVSQWICVSAIGTDVTLTFQGGSAAFIIPAGTLSPRFDVKCTSVTLTMGSSGSGEKASLLAGLTNVKTSQYPDISAAAGVV